MIETALFFILGFLCAVFIGIFISPALFRLSYKRSRKDVEAALPLTLDEINAKTDGIRARYAAEVASLEMRIKRSEEARAVQKITLGKNHQQLKRIPELEQALAANETELQTCTQTLEETQKAAQQLRSQAEKLSGEHSELLRHHAELKELAEITRLELATNETNSDNLHSQIAELRRSHKDFDMRENKLKAEITAAQTALKNEKQKNVQLEERLARLISLLSDAEEKLSRTTKDKTVAEDNIREELQDIAAEMVLLSAEQEGEQSPVHAIMAKAPEASALDSANESRQPKSHKKTSLSKRIDTLSRSR